MARPKTIKLKDGIISLSGFPKEVGEALALHIKAFGRTPSEVVVLAGAPITDGGPRHTTPEVLTYVPPALPKPSGTLASRAVGVNRENGEIRLVTVAYDLATKTAAVETVSNPVPNKEISSMFKMAADKHRFI